jgi:hypothetical protein
MRNLPPVVGSFVCEKMSVEEVCRANAATEKAQKVCKWRIIPGDKEMTNGEPQIGDFDRVKNKVAKELSVGVSTEFAASGSSWC